MIYQYEALGSSVFQRDSGGPTTEFTEAGSITEFAIATDDVQAKKFADRLNELLVARGRRRIE